MPMGLSCGLSLSGTLELRNFGRSIHSNPKFKWHSRRLGVRLLTIQSDMILFVDVGTPFLILHLLHPVHTHVNIIRVLFGVCVWNRRFGIHLGLEDVLHAYTIKSHSSGKYYFIANAKPLHLVINLSDQ